MKQILSIIAIAIILTSCVGNTKKQPDNWSSKEVTNIIYFHGKKRCITCNSIEQLSKYVVDSLASKNIVMRIVDISQKENEAIADKYKVSWSTLIVEHDGTTDNLTEMGFSQAKNNPAIFKAQLIESINKISQ